MAATARRSRPARSTSASASQSGTGARDGGRRDRPDSGERPRRRTDRGQGDRSGGSARLDALERLGVGLAVAAHAVDPHRADGHGVARRRRDDPGGAVERGEHPVAGASRPAATPASGSDSSDGGARARAPRRDRAGPAQVVERGVGEHDAVPLPASARRAQPNASTTSSSVRAAAVVVGGAGDHEREVAQVVAQLLELGEPLVADDRGDRAPVPRRPRTSVPWAASATSRATPRRLASVTLSRSARCHRATVQ